MPDDPLPQQQVRRTISLTPKVDEWAGEMMADRGFDNFSAYVADLVRRDKEKAEEDRRLDERRRLELAALERDPRGGRGTKDADSTKKSKAA